MEVNLANLVDDHVVVESHEAKAAVPVGKVATHRHVYRAKPREPSQFGSVSGSEIHFQPTFSNGICI